MRRWSVVQLLIVLLGVVAAPTALATTERVIVPFQTTEDACSGETVRLRGQLLLIFHFEEDSGGGIHGHFSLVPRDVTGVSEGGVKYRAVGGQRDTFNISGSGTFTETFTDQFILVSQESDENLLVRTTFHITITREGQVTAFVANFSAKCVG
jgi:hypothetical protein